MLLSGAFDITGSRQHVVRGAQMRILSRALAENAGRNGSE
jgi:hypothetical protein